MNSYHYHFLYLLLYVLLVPFLVHNWSVFWTGLSSANPSTGDRISFISSPLIPGIFASSCWVEGFAILWRKIRLLFCWNWYLTSSWSFDPIFQSVCPFLLLHCSLPSSAQCQLGSVLESKSVGSSYQSTLCLLWDSVCPFLLLHCSLPSSAQCQLGLVLESKSVESAYQSTLCLPEDSGFSAKHYGFACLSELAQVL